MRLACPGLFSWFEKNVTVVTPSRLLASVAYQQFAVREIQAGRESWQRPPILSLGAWLTRCWQEARYSHPDVLSLLSSAQEHLLWRQIIESENPDLFDPDATAERASSAARLLAERQLSAESAPWSDYRNAAPFRRWLHLFRGKCEADGWITRAGLWQELFRWAERSEPVAFLLRTPPHPALANLRLLLGSRISLERFETSPGSLQSTAQFASASDELEFAARWARSAFESNRSHSIAVFIAGLPSRQAEVERAFRDTFYSGSCRSLIDARLSAISDASLAYNLLAPRPLFSEPLVAGAMQLLELAQDRIPMSAAGAILRCRWLIGASAEKSARASADGELRRLRELDVSLSDLETASARCPRLQQVWQPVRRILNSKEHSATFSAWARFVGGLLGALGWPGDAELTPKEQTTLDAWNNALSQLASLALVAGEVTFETALVQLRRLLASGVDNESSLLAPVQILNYTGAGGLQFDTALITGLGEETWPPSQSPSPFIPLALQRDQLREETAILRNELFSSAPQITATWSGRLSPAVAPTFNTRPPSSSPAPAWQGKTTWQSYKPAMLEEQQDIRGPALASDVVRGGTGIIKSQSLCPFRAFAEYRLNSNSLEEGCLGFDARDRGGHLHSVLESVWQKLRTLEALKIIGHAELEKLVEDAAHHAVRDQHASSFRKIVSSVELARLTQVTLEWLAVERARLQPFTVETVEEERYLELGGMKLRLRVDRIDRLRDGGVILIDYKSGEQKQRYLECPRPKEPQLLVYAAGIGSEVEGVVFAQLKRDDIRPVGWTRDRHFKKEGSKKTVDPLGEAWDECMAESQAEVEQLAREFNSGYAAVDPLAGACDYCAQRPFCRISERAQGSEAEAE